MSHTYAARCTVCAVTDDPMCPECRTPSSAHGTVSQRPWTTAPDPNDGYVHEWHAACLNPPTVLDGITTECLPDERGARDE